VSTTRAGNGGRSGKIEAMYVVPENFTLRELFSTRKDVTIVPSNNKCRNEFSRRQCSNFLIIFVGNLPGFSVDLERLPSSKRPFPPLSQVTDTRSPNVLSMRGNHEYRQFLVYLKNDVCSTQIQ
jgi:hypothetical protein